MIIVTNIASQQCRWRIFSGAEELEQAVADLVLDAAREAISVRDVFHLVLAGGNTPRRIHECLRAAEADWPRWQIWFGDERCLPPDDAERNSRMARTAWLDHAPIPSVNIHCIPAERGPDAGAAAYAHELAGVAEFDLVLLGLGEDGHTASLFPGRDWSATGLAPVLAITDAPKPPPQRVSLSPARLAATRQLVFLVTGAGKRTAVRDWRTGIAIPASRIAPRGGVDIFLDAAASGEECT
jgi:6-phosphogluconolactonase